MSETYYWLPARDESLDRWVRRRTLRGGYVLPTRATSDGYPELIPDYRKGRWSSLQGNDVVYICVHGRASSLSTVGCVNDRDIKLYSAEDLANEILRNLFMGGKRRTPLDYRLAACWGANRMLFLDSFGKKLSTSLADKGIQGTLTAYKGSKLMTSGDYQSGSSRFTSLLLSKKKFRVQENLSRLEQDHERNKLGVRMIYQSDDQAVQWNLA